MRGIELASHLADSSSQTTIGSLFALIGIVVVALIGAIVTLVTTKWNLGTRGNDRGGRSIERVTARREALELWIALNTDVDPRKIKTGYESHAEVARAPT